MNRKPNALSAHMAAEKRRQRTLWGSLITVALLLVAGLIGYGIYTSQRADTLRFPKGISATDNSAISTGTGPVTVDIYADFLCPRCREFEQANRTALNGLAGQNKITLAFHPVSILDYNSTTKYSSRAAAAAGCAADQGKFDAYATALYDNQPEEGGAGLSNGKLIDIGKSLGLGSNFADCIAGRDYRGWAQHVGDVAASRGVSSTPTIMINGKLYDGERTPAKLTAAITAAGTAK